MFLILYDIKNLPVWLIWIYPDTTSQPSSISLLPRSVQPSSFTDFTLTIGTFLSRPKASSPFSYIAPSLPRCNSCPGPTHREGHTFIVSFNPFSILENIFPRGTPWGSSLPLGECCQHRLTWPPLVAWQGVAGVVTMPLRNIGTTSPQTLSWRLREKGPCIILPHWILNIHSIYFFIYLLFIYIYLLLSIFLFSLFIH